MLLREHPDLRLAGATWGWLAAALRSMDWLRAPGRATSPRRCWWWARARTASASPRQTKAFAARAPHAEYVEIADAEHEILMERMPIRAKFWAAFDAFHGKRKPRPGVSRGAAFHFKQRSLLGGAGAA